MQAFTALCRTKIVAATVIQRQAGFGVKIYFLVADKWKMYTSGASLLIYYKGELGLQS